MNGRKLQHYVVNILFATTGFCREQLSGCVSHRVAHSSTVLAFLTHVSSGAGHHATDEVQHAISMANANGGGIIYFPRGQYVDTWTLLDVTDTIVSIRSSLYYRIVFLKCTIVLKRVMLVA